MKTKLIKALVLGAAVSMSGMASAEPVALNDSQMDNVSAAGLVNAAATAAALGLFAAATNTYTATVVEAISITPIQGGVVTVTAISAAAHSDGVAY